MLTAQPVQVNDAYRRRARWLRCFVMAPYTHTHTALRRLRIKLWSPILQCCTCFFAKVDKSYILACSKVVTAGHTAPKPALRAQELLIFVLSDLRLRFAKSLLVWALCSFFHRRDNKGGAPALSRQDFPPMEVEPCVIASKGSKYVSDLFPRLWHNVGVDCLAT